MGCHNTAKPEIVMGLVLIEARNLPLTSSNVLCSTFIPPSRLRLVVPPSCLRRMVKGASCSRLLRGSFKNSHLLIGWCTRYPSNTIIGMTGLALNGRYIFFNWLKPWIDTSDFDLEFEICNNRGGLISWKPRGKHRAAYVPFRSQQRPSRKRNCMVSWNLGSALSNKTRDDLKVIMSWVENCLYMGNKTCWDSSRHCLWIHMNPHVWMLTMNRWRPDCSSIRSTCSLSAKRTRHMCSSNPSAIAPRALGVMGRMW